MRIPDGNGLAGTVWAPEVHKYDGKYYLFATINSDIVWKKRKEGWADYTWRGTQIFHADSPEGPFTPEAEPIKGVGGIDPCVLIDTDGSC